MPEYQDSYKDSEEGWRLARRDAAKLNDYLDRYNEKRKR